jgi:hypothetical protein
MHCRSNSSSAQSSRSPNCHRILARNGQSSQRLPLGVLFAENRRNWPLFVSTFKFPLFSIFNRKFYSSNLSVIQPLPQQILNCFPTSSEDVKNAASHRCRQSALLSPTDPQGNRSQTEASIPLAALAKGSHHIPVDHKTRIGTVDGFRPEDLLGR